MYLDKYDFEYLNQIRKEIIEKYYGNIKTSQLPGIDNDKIIDIYPDLILEGDYMTLTEREVRRRERKERRAKRKWWLRWY